MIEAGTRVAWVWMRARECSTPFAEGSEIRLCLYACVSCGWRIRLASPQRSSGPSASSKPISRSTTPTCDNVNSVHPRAWRERAREQGAACRRWQSDQSDARFASRDRGVSSPTES